MPRLTNPYRRPSEKKQEVFKIYNDSRWKHPTKGVRILKLKQNPLCERCLRKIDEQHPNGIITAASQVHHIISFWKFQGAEREKYAYDIDNLESVCEQCHKELHDYKEKIDINKFDTWD